MSIRTEPVGIVPHSVHVLLSAECENPHMFLIEKADEGSITLLHHVDDVDTTLALTLYPNGTWVAQKHVEV